VNESGEATTEVSIMRLKPIATLMAAAVLGLHGCATTGPREQSGLFIGATLGALVGATTSYSRRRDWYHGGDGYSTAAIVIGALAGAAIGGAIGRHMDDLDRRYAGYALENVRTGVPSTWRNPDTGHESEITPTETYETRSGPCREYTLEAMIGGRSETVYGTACRQPDGSWRMQPD
jgi:surface antigen